MDNYQVMPPLSDLEYQELKSSIAKYGVQVAIEYDEDGNILDGHHRLQACKELGIQNIPKVVKMGMAEPQKLDYALMVNVTRRQLSREQKQELIRQQLKRTPEKSNRQIAELTGVSDKTVGSQRKELESTAEIPQFTTNVGADGKVRPRKPVTLYRPDEKSLANTKTFIKSAAPEFVNAVAEEKIPLKDAVALAGFVSQSKQAEAVRRMESGEADTIMEGLDQIKETQQRNQQKANEQEPDEDKEDRAIDHVNRNYCLLAEKVLNLGSDYPAVAQRLLATNNWTYDLLLY